MFKKNFTLKLIIVFVFLLLPTIYVVNTYNKFNSISIGSNIDEVKQDWGEPYFQSTSQGKIHLHYRSLFIYQCVFIYNEKDSLLIKKWRQVR